MGAGRGMAVRLAVLAVLVLPQTAVAAEKIDIEFALSRVTNKYAINLPGFREIFRFFDVGHAGCSIDFTVNLNKKGSDKSANPKLIMQYAVRLIESNRVYKGQSIGALDRDYFNIYLYDKCSDVGRLQISRVNCFNGFKNQFGKLTCPYRFGVGSFLVQRLHASQGGN